MGLSHGADMLCEYIEKYTFIPKTTLQHCVTFSVCLQRPCHCQCNMNQRQDSWPFVSCSYQCFHMFFSLSLSLYNKWSVLPFSVLSRFRRYCLIFDSLYLDLSDRFLLCGHWLVLFVGEHPFQGSAGRAVAALLWEAQEDGPDEGTAAGERGPHVQRHQGKVQKLRIDTGRDYSILKSF